jgi:hemerythrin-like metal-binding protein
MEKQGYPNIEEHIKEHRQFVDELREMCDDINQNTHIQDIGEFVSAWLVQHVLDEDMNYKKYIEEKQRK